jgi:glycosyltransferase involved in cell wall biosynthesis
VYRKDLSIVIAVNNEEDNIAPLYTRVKVALEALTCSWEILLVDDGSSDDTLRLAREIARSEPRVIPVSCHQSVGQTRALLEGLKRAEGDVIVTMDGDLQHRPEDIPRFVSAIQDGCGLVNGRKIRRQDNLLTRTIPALIAKTFVRSIFTSPIRDINSTFRAYRRDIICALLPLGECIRFAPLVVGPDTKLTEIEIECPRRLKGRSHFNFSKRIGRLWRDILLLREIRGLRRNPCQSLRYPHK